MKKMILFAVIACTVNINAETFTFNTPADWQQKKFFTENANGGMAAVLNGGVLSNKREQH